MLLVVSGPVRGSPTSLQTGIASTGNLQHLEDFSFMSNDIVSRAKALAHRAHAGQVDKAGLPYIEHVARVAAAVSDDTEAEAVAWLHDLHEDCVDLAWHIWKNPSPIRYAALLLSREWMPFRDYYKTIKANPLALRVKLADIADNADEERLALLDPETANRLRKKYKAAIEALTG